MLLKESVQNVFVECQPDTATHFHNVNDGSITPIELKGTDNEVLRKSD